MEEPTELRRTKTFRIAHDHHLLLGHQIQCFQDCWSIDTIITMLVCPLLASSTSTAISRSPHSHFGLQRRQAVFIRHPKCLCCADPIRHAGHCTPAKDNQRQSTKGPNPCFTTPWFRTARPFAYHSDPKEASIQDTSQQTTAEKNNAVFLVFLAAHHFLFHFLRTRSSRGCQKSRHVCNILFKAQFIFRMPRGKRSRPHSSPDMRSGI